MIDNGKRQIPEAVRDTIADNQGRNLPDRAYKIENGRTPLEATVHQLYTIGCVAIGRDANHTRVPAFGDTVGTGGIRIDALPTFRQQHPRSFYRIKSIALQYPARLCP